MTAPPSRTPLVLVTGGAGFIGSHTVDFLLAEGERVRVVDDLRTGRMENLPAAHPALEFVCGDIRDTALLERVMRGVTHVLHLAAQVSVEWSVRDPVSSCSENVLGFVAVLDAARRAGARLVYASSAAVYGDPGPVPVSESAPIAPLSPYGLEKAVDEAYADLYARLHAYPSLGLRYFNVYGPRQDPASPYSGVIAKFLARLARGAPLEVHGDGLQERDFVHVRDVAHVNVHALFGEIHGVVNVARGESVSVRELVCRLERAARRPLATVFVPEPTGAIRSSRADIGRLREELFLPGIGLEEGLEELLAG